MPTNYPPVERAGRALSGMGTPDLEGTFGTFTYYTDDPSEPAGAVPGGRIVPVAVVDHRAVLPIDGPANSLRRDHRPVRLEMVADIDPDAPAARFKIGAQQLILKQGEWSQWIRVRFPLLGRLAGVEGMFRLYARELHPGLRIYRSPLNVDPADPALPVSAPESYGRELARRIGPFYTQGIEEDTAALRQGVLALPEYLEQSRLVAEEHTALLRDSLDRFREGLLFFYFSTIDRDSHMLWGRHEAELLRTYQAVDGDIGRVLDHVRDIGATVIVMSDHGFAAFNRGVNLNTWLWREGFLARGGPSASIDWKRTRAYAMGLNALYLNLKDRAERDRTLEELARRLREFRDPETGDFVIADVRAVGKSASVFAPDLIVGYAPGYRASWETALGDVPADVIRINTDAWIGDHCIAAAAVPGVLLGNRRPRVSDPQLKDLTVTILKEFGVAPDAAMNGRAVY